MAAEVLGEVEPLLAADPAGGAPLTALVEAIASMFAQPEEAVRATEGLDPYTQTLDVTRAPGWLLPWLCQVVGVVPPLGASEAELRALIAAEGGWRRGWLTSFLAAVAGTLTGTKRIRLTERNSTAWNLLVNTKPSETPSLTATERAGNLQKAGGLIATYVTIEAPLIDEAVKTIDAATVATMDTATISQV